MFFFSFFLFFPLVVSFGLHIFFNYLPFSHYLDCYNKNIYYCKMVFTSFFYFSLASFSEYSWFSFLAKPVTTFFMFFIYIFLIFLSTLSFSFSFLLLFSDALKSFSFLFIHFLSLLHQNPYLIYFLRCIPFSYSFTAFIVFYRKEKYMEVLHVFFFSFTLNPHFPQHSLLFFLEIYHQFCLFYSPKLDLFIL